MSNNKLVRDKVPQIIRDSGLEPVSRIADDQEYWQELKKKLQEELNEFLENDSNLEEIADIMEVLNAIMAFKNIDPKKVEEIRVKKLAAKGAFQKKIILESVR